MTGPIYINNLNSFETVRKYRTVNDTVIGLSIGIGGAGIVCLEHHTCPNGSIENDTVDGRIEINSTMFTSTVPMVAPTKSKYNSYNLKNIAADTGSKTANSSSLTTGYIYLQYE